MFLCGYGSDMEGTKALALEAWAKARDQAFLRFDYAGCGASEGAFEDQTLAGWRDDALRMIDLPLSAIGKDVQVVASGVGDPMPVHATIGCDARSVRALAPVAARVTGVPGASLNETNRLV